MIDPGNVETVAIRLAELSREIDDLERGRANLLERLNRAREAMNAACQRTAAMRASLDLLCDHIRSSAVTLTELHAIEEEMNEIRTDMEENSKEARSLLFEADSFSEALDETEDDLEHLSSIFIEGKSNRSRGH